MTDTISKMSAVPNLIANDGSEVSIVSATVLTDDAPAVAGVTVNWTAVGGELSGVTSVTDENGVASISVTVKDNSATVDVTASTADDSQLATISTYQPLAAPVVINATVDDGYTLDHYDLNFGVQALIPIYADMMVGQTVTFHWGEADKTSFIVTEAEHPPFVIDVSSEMSPDCLKDGSYAVYYVAVDHAGNETKSSTINLTVSDSGSAVPTLSAADVPEADPYINISDASDGVIVNISYPSMVAGDVVTYFWTGFDSASRQITGTEATEAYTVVDGDTTVSFTVPMESFYPNGKGYEGHAEVYYTVTTAEDNILELSDTRTCLVDTVAP